MQYRANKNSIVFNFQNYGQSNVRNAIVPFSEGLPNVRKSIAVAAKGKVTSGCSSPKATMSKVTFGSPSPNQRRANQCSEVLRRTSEGQSNFLVCYNLAI